jgi:multidrug efflux pump subunit AcrA (membrane-fusion protein)
MKPTTSIIATLSLTASALLSGCGTGEAAVSSEESILAATPVPVEVAQPFRTDIFATYEATATITSDADAPVVARAAGEIIEMLVEEGDRVTEGLAAKANLKQASTEYERNVDLHERGLIAASMFDALQYNLEELEATYELKKLAYDYSNIRAPISGIVSSRYIKLGQHLSISNSGNISPSMILHFGSQIRRN